MTTRQSALFALFLGSLGLAALSGCSAGNPDMSAAEDAMEKKNYEQALTSVESAIDKDSANAEAYAMKARILRQMADSTTPPAKYEKRYEQARQAEQKAINFDPGQRSNIKSQRKLSYIQEYRKGADAFKKARRTQSKEDFLRAAAFFSAAGAARPDSSGPILNEAFARLQAAQLGDGGQAAQEMSEVIPLLERYLEKTDQPSKTAYTILVQLYRQDKRPEKAIEMAERALEDLSNRPTHFRVSGTRGVKYTGTIKAGGTSRSVEGTVPDRIELSTSTGTVSGSFQKKEGGKKQMKGRLQVRLYMEGTEAASDQSTSSSEAVEISTDLTGMTPLAELRNQRLNALNKTGQTERVMQAYKEQIKRNPEDATYRYNYGSLLLNSDRYDEAAEQLEKAAELDPDDPKKQYNLGAAYLNRGVALQERLVSMRDSVLKKDRNPTSEEREKIKKLNQQRRTLFKNAIPPLERARQLSGATGEYRQDACSALLQAYVQTEQTKKAKEVEKCAGKSASGTGEGSGGMENNDNRN